ncbi:putative tRNA (adenine(37)-N6)-methyltransferase [Enhygromyxa salina]|uniref:Putative tRNA (Adenine(37)-N6)-methyltransferase n=1 Tax=Enhygromyxa salina TaxID=215803 RepID=A0A2S9XAT2_9BACT|nr:tRNA (N6-threonylcarbamoyladenosine(37)-N6)-methyltransferase TrmO [Enhygromyxa salina]PRP89966.1 putative tRNA (adenine(37)-N6)-methyltransferase [Enhygromyxa salina]
MPLPPRAPISLEPIGLVRSPWKEKFAIPRQSGMAQGVELTVELDPERIPAESLRGLEQVSHLWLLCWFHACADEGWRPTVRPPRLGGSARLGVFATRSPHRPNPIALSLVRLIAVEGRRLRVAEADLLDGTPVLDIKPYLPWAELRPEARCDWAPSAPISLEVRLSDAAAEVIASHPRAEQLRRVIVESLRWDPRPAHQRADPKREFAAAILDVDVRFCVDATGVHVLAVRRSGQEAPEPG